LTGERFANVAVSSESHSFPGKRPLIPAVLGGHVEIGLLNVPEVVSQYKAGEMKVICVFSDRRSQVIPQAPTAKEQGFNVSGGVSHFIVVPNNVPVPVRRDWTP